MSLTNRLLASRDKTKLAVLIVSVAVGLILPILVDKFLLSMMLLALVYGLLAMSVNLMGYGGILSLGHAGIFASSAYGTAYVATHVHGGYPEQIFVGMLVAVLMSAVFGVMAMRTAGVYFLMVTLAQGEIIFGLAGSFDKYTGGDNGLTGITRPSLVSTDKGYYYLCLIAVLVCALLMWVIVKSPFGLALRGLSNSPTRLQQLGYNPTLHKFYGFVLAGIFAGIAGILFVYEQAFISPDAASFTLSANAVIMVILGGIGTMSGPLIGSITIVGIQNWLSAYVERWPTVEGLLFIAVVLFARNGFVGSISQLGQKWRHQGPRHQSPGEPVATVLAPSSPGVIVDDTA